MNNSGKICVRFLENCVLIVSSYCDCISLKSREKNKVHLELRSKQMPKGLYEEDKEYKVESVLYVYRSRASSTV